MIDPLTSLIVGATGWLASALTSSTAQSIYTNMASSQLLDPVCRRIRLAFTDHMSGRDGSLPRNHDVEKAVRTAGLKASRAVVARFAASAERQGWQSDLGFATAAAKWVEVEFLSIEMLSVDQDGLAQLIAALDAPLSDSGVLKGLAEAATRAALKELEDGAGVAPSQRFRDRFMGDGAVDGQHWFDAFGAFLAEEIKENDRFRAILTAARLAEINSAVRETEALVREMLPRLREIEETTRETLRVVKTLRGLAEEQRDLALDAYALGGETRDIARKTQDLLIEFAQKSGAGKADIEALRQRLSQVIKRGRIKDRAIRGFLEDMSEVPVAPDQWAEQLSVFAQRYRELLDQIQVRTGLPRELESMRLEAENAVRAGRLDLAESHLANLSQKIRSWRQERQQVLDGMAREESQIFERRAEVAKARLRYGEAAALFDEAAKALPETDWSEIWTLKMQQARMLHELCSQFGDPEAGQRCVDLIDPDLIDLAERLGPQQQMESHRLLGLFWSTRGRQTKGTAGLKQSIAAYEAALDHAATSGDEDGLANILNQLANVWMLIGARTDDLDALHRSAEIYGTLLKSEGEGRLRLPAGTLKNNLGNVYRSLGDLNGDPAMMEKALDCFRQAKAAAKDDRRPHRRAQFENNIGITLWMIGEHHRRDRPVRRAVEIHEKLLAGSDVARQPLAWARAHHNLGLARLTLGEILSDVDLIEAAWKNFDQAADQRASAAVESDWSLSILGRGRASFALSRLTQAVDRRASALEDVTACQAAVEASGNSMARRMCRTLVEDLERSASTG